MKESEMNISEPNMIGHFARHMVGIGVTHVHGDPRAQNFFIGGFVASIKGE
jgi:hypothetical protein